MRTLKNKFYKQLTAVSKNVHVDKLDNTIDKYDNTYHRTIKMKLIDVKTSTYIDFDVKKVKIMIKILNLKLVAM